MSLAVGVCLVLPSNASVVDPFDPMEQAFHRLGERFLADTEHLHRDWRLVQTYALSPALRAMSHVWTADDGDAHIVAAKGAPEAVFDLCHLPPAELARAQAAATALADQGLRVLGYEDGFCTGPERFVQRICAVRETPSADDAPPRYPLPEPTR